MVGKIIGFNGALLEHYIGFFGIFSKLNSITSNFAFRIEIHGPYMCLVTKLCLLR